VGQDCCASASWLCFHRKGGFLPTFARAWQKADGFADRKLYMNRPRHSRLNLANLSRGAVEVPLCFSTYLSGVELTMEPNPLFARTPTSIYHSNGVSIFSLVVIAVKLASILQTLASSHLACSPELAKHYRKRERERERNHQPQRRRQHSRLTKEFSSLFLINLDWPI